MKIIKQAKSKIENDFADALSLMGLVPLEEDFYRRVDDLDSQNQLILYATIDSDSVEVSVYNNATSIEIKTFSRALDIIDYIETILDNYGIEPFEITSDTNIFCAANTRDLASKLQRVKSSNVWSYAFNPKDNNIGDMLMQFKNKDGGAGDVYIYYDVPNKIWRQLVGSSSKGHAFWKLIRNVYTYAKLTGDKRTHLPNGI